MATGETGGPEGTSGTAAPVKARGAIVDPESLEILWMNDAAFDKVARQEDLSPAPKGQSLESALPMAGALGLAKALREVAASGEPRHLRAKLVGMSQGSFVMAASVYRLPSSQLIVVMEETWQAKRRDSQEGGHRRGPSPR
jgi:hypothetical protein